jgi:phosphoglycolate phosphatase-like HAD superfamily hydrolase
LPNIVQTVLTGNLRAVAATKLRVFGLDRFVDFDVGAYGDDEEDRPKLVAVAQARARAKYGAKFSRDNTVIIGDSPSDIETGLRGGARVIGVASGKSSVTDLCDAGASLVLADLGDADRIPAAVGELIAAG